jgi:hypothetical protein
MENQLMNNELHDQVSDHLDNNYSDFNAYQQQQQHKSNLQRSASVQSAQELLNLYNLSLWKNAILENSNKNNLDKQIHHHNSFNELSSNQYNPLQCSQNVNLVQQQQQMPTTSSVTSAVVAALYNPYLLMNLLQNPIAFQAALTNRLLSLDNKTNA